MKKSRDIELKDYNKAWKRIPMNDIWPEVRRLAVLWAKPYYDIRETHKLAQDIQNMVLFKLKEKDEYIAELEESLIGFGHMKKINEEDE